MNKIINILLSLSLIGVYINLSRLNNESKNGTSNIKINQNHNSGSKKSNENYKNYNYIHNIKNINEGDYLSNKTNELYKINESKKNTTKVVINAGDGANILPYNFIIGYDYYSTDGTVSRAEYNANGYTPRGYILGSDVQKYKNTMSHAYLDKADFFNTITVYMPYAKQTEVHLTEENNYKKLLNFISQQNNVSYSIDALGILTDPEIVLMCHYYVNGILNTVQAGSFGIYKYYQSNDYYMNIIISLIVATGFAVFFGCIEASRFGICRDFSSKYAFNIENGEEFYNSESLTMDESTSRAFWSNIANTEITSYWTTNTLNVYFQGDTSELFPTSHIIEYNQETDSNDLFYHQNYNEHLPAYTENSNEIVSYSQSRDFITSNSELREII